MTLKLTHTCVYTVAAKARQAHVKLYSVAVRALRPEGIYVTEGNITATEVSLTPEGHLCERSEHLRD